MDKYLLWKQASFWEIIYWYCVHFERYWWWCRIGWKNTSMTNRSAIMLVNIETANRRKVVTCALKTRRKRTSIPMLKIDIIIESYHTFVFIFIHIFWNHFVLCRTKCNKVCICESRNWAPPNDLHSFARQVTGLHWQCLFSHLYTVIRSISGHDSHYYY